MSIESPNYENLASAGQQFVNNFTTEMPERLLWTHTIGKPQVNISIEVNNEKVFSSYDEPITKGLSLDNQRFYLSSILKPLMAIAYARMGESNPDQIDLDELYKLVDKVIYKSNDADLAILSQNISNIVHTESFGSLNTDPRDPRQTGAEIVQSILNQFLDARFDIDELKDDEQPLIFINRSKLSNNPEFPLPNSIINFQTLLQAYDLFWKMIDENPDDKLLQTVASAMSKKFSQEEYQGKTHDLRNLLISYLGSVAEIIFTKSGNNTNFYYYNPTTGFGTQSIKEEKFTDGTFVDNYSCVSRVILKNGDVLNLSYSVAIPFSASNDEFTSQVIRRKLEPILEELVRNIAEVIKS